METPYDWITVGIFAGLILLFLQRSTSGSEAMHDPIWKYLAAGVGCGLANYLGNTDMDLPAVFVIGVTLAFIFYFLKPFSSGTLR